MADSKESMVCLAVDTSGRFGSVVLGIGNEILGRRDFSGMVRQSSELFTSIQDLLGLIGKKAGQVEHFYLTIGPGSFTGLRISVTLAKMFAFCTNAKLVCISTMEALSANASRFALETNINVSRVGTVLDAKRGQFYVAAFHRNSGGCIRILEDSLVNPEYFLEWIEGGASPIWLLGEGLVFYKKRFESSLVEFIPESYWNPDAYEVYQIGRKKASQGLFTDPVTLTPVYLRGPDAVELKDRSLGR
ncbi:MAG: tRNA (adenosine(37)-N6)-threonylcarbamoyltransferase complex dimerization subunit type 1 TsaB [Sedimentisphaerales bacterium]|nr:tRNA (adenosine(37)-N6)-threonylcarbamoyltransferase complex dimerization subunit type 1 TsaB [Sedimentisphaerales bacterium]